MMSQQHFYLNQHVSGVTNESDWPHQDLGVRRSPEVQQRSVDGNLKLQSLCICDLICENRPLPAFWRSQVITAVLVPRHLGTRKFFWKAIRLTLVEIYSKVFVVLDKYFSQKMPCERVAKVCMSISVFVRVY